MPRPQAPPLPALAAAPLLAYNGGDREKTAKAQALNAGVIAPANS